MQFTIGRFQEMVKAANWSGFTHALVRDLTLNTAHVFNKDLDYIGKYHTDKEKFLVPTEKFCERDILQLNQDTRSSRLGILDLRTAKPKRINAFKKHVQKEFTKCPEMYEIYSNIIASAIQSVDERFVFVITTNDINNLEHNNDYKRVI